MTTVAPRAKKFVSAPAAKSPFVSRIAMRPPPALPLLPDAVSALNVPVPENVAAVIEIEPPDAPAFEAELPFAVTEPLFTKAPVTLKSRSPPPGALVAWSPLAVPYPGRRGAKIES